MTFPGSWVWRDLYQGGAVGATRLVVQICGRGWFWEARKICCSCCHHTDNTGRNVHIIRSIQQIDPCWYILIIIWLSMGENLFFFLPKKFYIVQALDIFCQKKSINEEKIWIHDWGKIKNYSQTYTLRFFVLIVHISPCVVSVMAAAAADFPSFPNPSTAADLYTEPSASSLPQQNVWNRKH